MPYKEPRVQVNVKLTPEEFAALVQDADGAETNTSQYARHLVVNRQAPPLSKGAYAERQASGRREAVLRKRLENLQELVQEQKRTLETANVDRGQWRLRALQAEADLMQAQNDLLDPCHLTTIIAQALEKEAATKRAAEQAAATEAPPASASSEEASSGSRRARRRL